MEARKTFTINEIVIGSFWYDVEKEKILFYTTIGQLHAEITMDNKQYSSLQKSCNTEDDLWNALADLFTDKEESPKRCPVCGRTPSIEYACGEYFITGREDCRFCGEFSKMHSLKNTEIKAWNKAVDAESQFERPHDGSKINDCTNCIYGGDYHFANGEYSERTKNQKINSYQIIYKEVLIHTFCVDAKSAQEARAKFEQKVETGEIDFSDGELDASEIISIEKL